MKLLLNNFDLFFDKTLSKKTFLALKEIVKSELIKPKYIIELTIINSIDMKALNYTYRKIDKDTDVLSFGSISNVIPHSFLLGEIFINYDRVLSQSRDYKHSIEREFLFLFTHGVYHLLDYDHLNKEDEDVMINKQLLILDKIKSYRI